MFPRIDTPPEIQWLLNAGRHAPSADNSQPWRFYWSGTNLTVKYDTQRVLGKTFGPQDHATLLAIGAVKENILQMSDFLNAEIEELRPANTSEYFHFKFKFRRSENSQVAEHSLFERHTNRWPYNPASIPTQVISSLGRMSQGQCQALVFGERDIIQRIAGWIRIASEARFQLRDVHEFLGGSLRFTNEEASRGDGLDVRTLPLPPGGKTLLRFIKDWDRLAFLNRFGCHKFLSLKEAKPVFEATHLIAISGPGSLADILDAGALMERVWIHLNSKGIAVQPYYVVTDQIERLNSSKVPAHLKPDLENLRSDVIEFLNSAGTRIHMLLRIGYPRTRPFRSMRLPLENVTEASTTDHGSA
jgi:hypothetical protein